MKIQNSISNRIGRCTAGVIMTCALLPLVAQASTNSLAAALNNTAFTWTTFGSNSAPGWVAQDVVTHDGDAAMQSGAVANNSQTSLLRGTAAGPGTLTFWWKVSSEASQGLLRMSVNGSVIATISGEVGWTQRTVVIGGSGLQTIGWQYMKLGSGSAGADAGWVDEVSFVSDLPQAYLTPTDVTVGVGGSATFNLVAVNNTNGIIYQWRRYGTNLPGATDASLTITNIGRKDRGTYTVLASNLLGGVIVSNSTLRVIVPTTLLGLTNFPNGTRRLYFADGDNTPLTQADRLRFTTQVSTNLVTWGALGGSLSFTNGVSVGVGTTNDIYVVTDINAYKFPIRYYRIREDY